MIPSIPPPNTKPEFPHHNLCDTTPRHFWIPATPMANKNALAMRLRRQILSPIWPRRKAASSEIAQRQAGNLSVPGYKAAARSIADHRARGGCFAWQSSALGPHGFRWAWRASGRREPGRPQVTRSSQPIQTPRPTHERCCATSTTCPGDRTTISFPDTLPEARSGRTCEGITACTS